MSLLLSVILFGVLVFIHEFGHFITAKLFGVKVEKFSLGFGPKIIGRQIGETYYQLSLLPLGGYVKMLGENPEDEIKTEELKRSFAHLHPLKKSLIVIMGPISNLLLPIIIFMVAFLIGWPQVTTDVGDVVIGSPAWNAGIRPHDRVVAVNDQKVMWYEDLTKIVESRAGLETKITIQRKDAFDTLTLTPEKKPSKNQYGEDVTVGKIGILPNIKKPIIGVEQSSILYTAGLRNADEIISINTIPIRSYYELELFFKTHVYQELKIEAKRGEETKQFTSATEETNTEKLGFFSGEFLVQTLEPHSPAEAAGLKQYDRLYSINDRVIPDFYYVQNHIFEETGKPFELGYYRNKELNKVTITPKQHTLTEDLTGTKTSIWYIGVSTYIMHTAPSMQIDSKAYLHPFTSLMYGAQKMLEIAKVTLIGFVKLFTGDVSLKAMGGPILIFKLTGASYQLGGILFFIKLMAILSITLGLINLLPIPVLDGGHLMFFLIEYAKGSPLNKKVLTIANQIGVILLVSLMVFAFYNDIMRFWN